MSKCSVVQTNIYITDNLITIRFEHIVNKSTNLMLGMLSEGTLRFAFPLTILLLNTLSIVYGHRRHRRSYHG